LKSFSELGLSKPLMQVLPELGFENPSPIQEQAIPLLNEKPQDFIGLAQTGTGKTAAFGLPLLDWINPDQKDTQALILAPTRELGQQIAGQLEIFAKYLPNIRIQSVYGGASIVVQMKDIKRRTPQIVIATPGRLLDLMRRKVLDLSTIRFVVLDEADEMLNMGFKEDLDDILAYTGDTKNTWLFSATMPKEIRHIVKSYMSKPVEVKVSTGNQVNENIEHQYAVVKSSDKFEGLKRVLDVEEGFRGVIFCRTRIKTQQLADDLNKSGYQSEALHGDLSQAQRDRVMKRFKDHSLQVLVATDVAARGIDVNDLTHVIHYALPDDPSYYTHRSGRTARAGKKGISLSLLTNRDMRKLDGLERSLKLKIDKISIPSVEDILTIRLGKWAQNILELPIKKDLNGKLLTDIQMLLGSMTFEELVEKLVSKEIDSLNYTKKSKDLNESSRASKRSSRDSDRRSKGRDRKGDRKSEKRDRSKSDFKRKDKSENRDRKSSAKKGNRFFINVGKSDGVSKSDMVDFIAETVKIRKSEVGDIDLQKNCSFFEVDSRHSKNVANSFKGIYIDGRELRVNRDSR
jgi:ATP-dependent RNA helicase DeaD|tara:strand:+ start:256 stop:1974 length:1719 start_codon:yes stop_codon:yes gene_type:complete